MRRRGAARRDSRRGRAQPSRAAAVGDVPLARHLGAATTRSSSCARPTAEGLHAWEARAAEVVDVADAVAPRTRPRARGFHVRAVRAPECLLKVVAVDAREPHAAMPGRESRRSSVPRAHGRGRRRRAASAEGRLPIVRLGPRALSVPQRRRDRRRRHDSRRARRGSRPERRGALVLMQLVRVGARLRRSSSASRSAYGAVGQTCCEAARRRFATACSRRSRRAAAKPRTRGRATAATATSSTARPTIPDMLPAPPVAGAKFLRKWNGRSLAALFEYVRVDDAGEQSRLLERAPRSPTSSRTCLSVERHAGRRRGARNRERRRLLRAIVIVSQSP